MENLRELIEAEGIDNAKAALSAELSVTEKINGHRLTIKKKRNGKIDFYTKKSKCPLCVIDSLMTDLYSDAISYILKKKEMLPHGETSFYLVKNDLDVSYTDVERQALVVTNTSNIESMSVGEIADKCGFREQRTLFSGHLSQEQIETIFSYFEGDRALPEVMSEALVTDVRLLNKDLSDVVEGYTFCIGGRLIKIEDKRFEKKEFKKINTSNYELLVDDIVEYVCSRDISSIEVSSEKHDFRYIDIIADLYNGFIEEKSKSEIDFLAMLPTFSDTTGNVNVNYMSDKKAAKYVLTSKKYEYLFRVFLQLFRRTLNERGLIGKDTCDKHEKLSKAIEFRASNIGMPTFEESIKMKNK